MADRPPRREPRLAGGVENDTEAETMANDDDSIAFEHEDEPTSGRHRRWPLVVFVLILLTAGAAVAGWFAIGLLTGGGSDSPPHLYAPEGPVKVRPEQPGGMDVPDRNREVYDRMEGPPPPPTVEHLLPRPEKPLPVPQAEAPAAPATGEPAPATGAGTAAQSPEVSPRPQTEGSVASPAAPSPAATPAPPPPPAPEVAQKPAPPAPPPAPARAAAPAAPATNGKFAVQVASVRDDAAINDEVARLRRVHGNLLAGLNPSVERADLGAKGVYFRLRLGPLADEAAAKALCAELERRKQACLVVRP